MDAIRIAYLQKGSCQPSHYDFPYMFELISNAYLYNIVFVNNLPSHLKNSGFATDLKSEAFGEMNFHLTS